MIVCWTPSSQIYAAFTVPPHRSAGHSHARNVIVTSLIVWVLMACFVSCAYAAAPHRRLQLFGSTCLQVQASTESTSPCRRTSLGKHQCKPQSESTACETMAGVRSPAQCHLRRVHSIRRRGYRDSIQEDSSMAGTMVVGPLERGSCLATRAWAEKLPTARMVLRPRRSSSSRFPDKGPGCLPGFHFVYGSRRRCTNMGKRRPHNSRVSAVSARHGGAVNIAGAGDHIKDDGSSGTP